MYIVTGRRGILSLFKFFSCQFTRDSGICRTQGHQCACLVGEKSLKAKCLVLWPHAHTNWSRPPMLSFLGERQVCPGDWVNPVFSLLTLILCLCRRLGHNSSVEGDHSATRRCHHRHPECQLPGENHGRLHAGTHCPSGEGGAHGAEDPPAAQQATHRPRVHRLSHQHESRLPGGRRQL